MINKLSVEKIDPRLVQHVRQVSKGKSKAEHPVYDVTEHKGTGKATCRGCGEIIKEGDPAILFWKARYDEGHELSFIRDRSIVHAEGCTEGPLVKCPHCSVQFADGTLSTHIQDDHKDRFQWKLRNRAASVTKLCFLHKKSHCGQCEDDRILEMPKFREELLELLGMEVTAAGYKRNPNQPPRDIKQEVTDRIIAALEQGTEPWTKPWTASGLPPTSIYNKPYSGINVILLGLRQQQEGFESPFWLTYNRAKSLGGYVKKDSKSTVIVKPKTVVKEVPGKFDESGSPLKETRTFFGHDLVFNLDQTEGIKLPKHVQAYLEERKNRPKVEVLPEVTQILQGYEGAPPIRHIEMGAFKNQNPHYSPMSDEIVLPHPFQFENPEAYARTAFHEAVHSTGHERRLNRLVPASFGSPDYAHEELVAELGSAILSGHVGLTSQNKRNEAYIGSWLKALKGDKNFIFDAASKAQKAVEHILGTTYQPAEYNPEDYEIDKTSSEWRHTDEDGFEMWETKEEHNEFAIVENDDKYDLYVLKGSFDSPEEAKAAADSTQKTAQDGGGGGGASGGGGGDGGAGGGDGGASAGASSSGGDAGDSGFSSSSGDSESNSDSDSDSDVDSDNDEDPRPPSEHGSCPRCGWNLNPIYLSGGRIYTCMNCGFTSRKKRKREINSSWFDRIPQPGRQEQNQEETPILSINPVLPPIFYEEEQASNSSPGDAGDLFSMN